MSSWNLKVPTAVPDFDSIIKGGIPNGSLVILSGVPGAGAHEFALTSAIKLAIARKHEDRRHFMFGGYEKDLYIPEKTCYISFSKSKEEIERIVELTLESDMVEDFHNNLQIKDFSDLYFKHTKVPRSWISSTTWLFKEDKDLLEEFLKFMSENGDGSITIIDSLTDLIISPSIDQSSLIDVIKGLEKATKKWNGVTYLILTEGVAEEKLKNIIFDAVDGILLFDWHGSTQYSQRFRYMYVLKFVGVMSHIEREHIVRFETKLDSKNGFVVVYTEKIR